MPVFNPKKYWEDRLVNSFSFIGVSDIDFGILSALSLGERDVGQAVIVKSGKVIIEEGKKGTADMLKRSRNLFPNGAGGILIKLKKPGQDRRMDLPTIGVNTIEQASQAGLIGIVVQAGDTIVIDQKAVIRTANEKGIFIKAINLKEPI